MTINLSNGLIGLSVLSGTNSFLTFGTYSASFETRAVRQAKAQFTAPATTPPWKEPAPSTPISAQVSTIKRMATIIDRPITGSRTLPADVQSAFTTYKALDRLRLLAESAVKTGTVSAERLLLESAFAKGLGDLQGFLGTAPSDKVQLSFAQPSRRAESVAVLSPAAQISTEVAGQGIVSARDAALPGLTGTEQFSISLSKRGTADTVTVDLAGTTQPPTLDSVAAAINAAIAAIPSQNADGTPVLDASGNPVPKWQVSFAAAKHEGKWGFAINRQGTETVGIDQIGAGDALMVATGVSAVDAPSTARIMRFDDLAGAMDRHTLGTIAGLDRAATERAEMNAPPPKKGEVAEPAEVWASTTTSGIVTDADGFNYMVSTTSGDLDANRSDGAEDLILSKLDSEGEVVWHRSLGASGSARGAAISIADNGDIVVAGTVQGAFDGASSDGDMLVARFDAQGDEKFASLVRAAGADKATAVTVGQDGSIFVGGRAASGGGDGFIARLDAGGRLQERRTIDSGGTDGVTALAIGADGELLALTREGTEAKLRRIDAQALGADLATLSLGTADARAIAVAADGSIAVGGMTSAALGGAQVNATAGGRDGFVARIDAGLGGMSVTYLASTGQDQVDSVAFLGDVLYAGGRTTGALAGSARQGAVDGFVSRLDTATGVIETTRQFGQAAQRTEPIRVAVASGGDTVLGALGLRRGTITPQDSAKLVAQTSLRAGDEFSIRIDGGAVRKITIAADDTLTTLSDRVRRLTGIRATVTTPKAGDGNALRIDVKPGHSIEFIAGAEGRDALPKLGIAAARVSAAEAAPEDAPRVRPGGSFGLGLTTALSIGTAEDAAAALSAINQAISMTQTGYRSLYWDDSKAALVNGGSKGIGGASTSREAAQLANYQAALTRLASTDTTTGFMGF